MDGGIEAGGLGRWALRDSNAARLLEPEPLWLDVFRGHGHGRGNVHRIARLCLFASKPKECQPAFGWDGSRLPQKKPSEG